MSDESQGWSCHNCGDPVAENTIYCDNCSYVRTDDSADTNGSASEKTWEDVEDTRSGFLALIAQLVLKLSLGALLLVAVVELVRKYIFGVPDTSYWLILGTIFVLLAISIIFEKTWTAFRLLGPE